MQAISKESETHATTSAPTYNLSIGYLRAFITLLVVAHHAALAYCPFTPPAIMKSLAQQPWRLAFPVVDTRHSMGMGLLVAFNDIFFMALMFFLSGLFVWKSLQRKGSGTFVRDRLVRLGLPFIVAAGLIAPLAYYPTYLQSGGHGIAGFWQQWKSLGTWPAGPAWFVWVLLVFDGVLALVYRFNPGFGEKLGRLSSVAKDRPQAFAVRLVFNSALVYIPLCLMVGPERWSSYGPFFFQTSRILLYFIYFLAGISVGAYGLQRGLFSIDGNLQRRWGRWTAAAAVAFLASILIAGLSGIVRLPPWLWQSIVPLFFVISCAMTSFAAMAIFVHFTRRRIGVWDSLTDNAYGIYLVHYAFVSWLQYSLLKFALPGAVKGWVVFAGAVLLSWGTTAALRKMPAVARVI